MQKNEFDTFEIDDVLANAQPLGHLEAQQELHKLKLLAANEFIQNFCENNGVPKEVVHADDNALIAWARDRRQREINDAGKPPTLLESLYGR